MIFPAYLWPFFTSSSFFPDPPLLPPSFCLLPLPPSLPLLPPTVYPVVNMSVTTSGSQAMILCEAYGYPALTDVTILGGTSTSNISPQDNFTSWGRASSTQPLMGCPTTFQCKATNGFGATTIQTMACSGMHGYLHGFSLKI